MVIKLYMRDGNLKSAPTRIRFDLLHCKADNEIYNVRVKR